MKLIRFRYANSDGQRMQAFAVDQAHLDEIKEELNIEDEIHQGIVTIPTDAKELAEWLNVKCRVSERG